MNKINGKKAHGATEFVKLSSARSNTGVVGITETIYCPSDRKPVRVFVVTPHQRRFNIERLGRDEALRRAMQLRASHEALVLPRQLAMPRTRLQRKEASRG